MVGGINGGSSDGVKGVRRIQDGSGKLFGGNQQVVINAREEGERWRARSARRIDKGGMQRVIEWKQG